ncbi:formate--tetrahydrofolate ligase [Microbacterium horticulturae]|uniref:Formate--tetrahydrofolate ligase n=1 Tax=Microbacterium horticulturae TaxID=3028316 RepID=A0ABY8C1K6_9MICO|nr:formate--tetrahydrofolate ligase [Microbacterium sp. KACC 23027]WEG09135.1 formate--tetrahydrofolate ligase [Microbacterium sp. KACC 23027]
MTALATRVYGAEGITADAGVRAQIERLAAGARFIVMICGNIMTMPGLPARPGPRHPTLFLTPRLQ